MLTRRLISLLLFSALCLSCVSRTVAAQSVGEMAPVGHQQFFDTNGNPLSGGSLLTSESGGGVALATYSDAALTTANPTTITLNAAGRPEVSSAEVGLFLDPTKAYRFVVKNASGSTIWTADNVGKPSSGTYAPTLTGVANIDSVVAGNAPFNWMLVGKMVMVAGRVTIDATANTTATSIGISFPIASNITATDQVAGTGSSNPSGTLEQDGAIAGDTSTDRAQLVFTSGTTSAASWSVLFMYPIP